MTGPSTADPQTDEQTRAGDVCDGVMASRSATGASACANDAPHPATRALDVARGLFDTLRPPPAELADLLRRWRDRADVPLQDRALAMIAAMVATDALQEPVTIREVFALIADLRAFFGSDRATMRSELAKYLTIRGATAQQRMRADALLRDEIGGQPSQVEQAA